MRIGVINWTNRLAGGAETYIRQIIPAMRERGHHIAFVHEVEVPAEREPIVVTDSELSWCAAQSGVLEVSRRLAAWHPDALFIHGVRRQDWLLDLVKAVPTAFFCHDYAGICVSGTKTFRTFSQACDRPFGKQCLAHYYPFHCGGWNPATMFREYERQSNHLALLRLGTALVTASKAVRQQYLNNGFAPERVHVAPYMPGASSLASTESMPLADPLRLLFAGRMEWMKGGDVLLDALSIVAASLQRRVHVTFSGDGTCRPQWEHKASQMQSESIRIEFIGWQPLEAVHSILDAVHLLVMPSLWPEPFGLSGIEAGCHGVPVAAFDVGGISEWLTDGVNGFLAPGNPPTATGLAEAIARCLRDADTYRRLRAAAAKIANQFTTDKHVHALDTIFAQMLERKAA